MKTVKILTIALATGVLSGCFQTKSNKCTAYDSKADKDEVFYDAIQVPAESSAKESRKTKSEYKDGDFIILNDSGTEQEFNTEQYDYIAENQFCDPRNSPLSTFSIDVDAASYSNVRRFINGGILPPPDAVRIEELVNYFDYDYPAPDGKDPFSITSELAQCPWNRQHYLVHIGLQGKNVKLENMPPGNLVFLLDVSGSMNDPDKLPLLKKSLGLLVDQLCPQDNVAIVVYAGAAGVVLNPTSGAEKEKIRGAIENLSAGGSTAGGEGIQLAYKLAKKNFDPAANNRVILATDGDFNVGVSSDGDLVRIIEEKRKEGVYLSVLGFGQGNYKDSKMEKLADKGNGNYAYIDNILEARKVLVNEMGGTLLTIAKDVKIQVEFNPQNVKGYRLIGYENRVLANEDFNNDKKDAGELGAGHSVTALYEIIPSTSSESLPGVDPLKYQQAKTVTKNNGEMLTVKFRYKNPGINDTVSRLIEKSVMNKPIEIVQASENFRFSASVAAFGLLLRNSSFKGEANFKDMIAMAQSSKGTDDEGYRSEFIRLAKTCEALAKK